MELNETEAVDHSPWSVLLSTDKIKTTTLYALTLALVYDCVKYNPMLSEYKLDMTTKMLHN